MSRHHDSPAVMARRKEPHDSLDDFPTPPWAARALIEEVIYPYFEFQAGFDATITARHLGTCWEPACNRGYMADALRPYFQYVAATDVHDYGYRAGHDPRDFLFPDPQIKKFDWVITNPPFRLGQQFIERALEVSRVGCAMFVRTQFIEGETRYHELFSTRPPTIFAQFAERVPLFRGVVRQSGSKYTDPATGKEKTASTATAYCWLVWIHGHMPAPPVWIPPCREKYERPGDYDERE